MILPPEASIAQRPWDALGDGATWPAADRNLALARKMDETEARAIRSRYTAFIGTAR